MLEPGLTQRRADRSGTDDRDAHECLLVFQASSDTALAPRDQTFQVEIIPVSLIAKWPSQQPPL
jgi:hypothetical protein